MMRRADLLILRDGPFGPSSDEVFETQRNASCASLLLSRMRLDGLSLISSVIRQYPESRRAARRAEPA